MFPKPNDLSPHPTHHLLLHLFKRALAPSLQQVSQARAPVMSSTAPLIATHIQLVTASLLQTLHLLKSIPVFNFFHSRNNSKLIISIRPYRHKKYQYSIMKLPFALPCWAAAPSGKYESQGWKPARLVKAATLIDLHEGQVWGQGRLS